MSLLRISLLLVALSLTVGLVSSGVVAGWSSTAATDVTGVKTDLSNTGENVPGLGLKSLSLDRNQPRAGRGTATRTVTTAGANQSVVRATTYVSRHQTDGLVGVRIEIAVPESLASVNISVFQQLTVQTTTGLNSTGGGRYHWDGGRSSSAQTLTLSGTYRVSQESQLGGLDFTDTGDWVLLRDPLFVETWQYFGEPPVLRETLALANGTTGYAGNRVAYLGPAETETATRNGQRFRAVVASTVNFDDKERARLFDHFATASERFDVGYADDGVTAFVVGDPIRRGGLALSTRGPAVDDLWINAENSDQSTRFSEYVHTRQTFGAQLTPRMAWLTEAMDGYYSAALARDLDPQARSFREDIVRDATDYASVDLLSPEHPLRADYDKGARVLAALDARIRTQTNGQRSFEHVWARLNARDEDITYGDFKSVVETVAGEPQDDWLTRSLTTNDLPSVPRNRSMYTVRDREIDPDEDGVPMYRETAVGTDPLQSDTDGDGLTDATELNRTTDPLVEDTDGDGLDDGREIELGTNATATDTDGDGLTDSREVEVGTDPTAADTDDDGLDDDREIEAGTDPTAADTDDDGLTDGREIELGTNATATDTDGDGLTDSREVEVGTDPTAADTDSDGVGDAAEVTAGSDPTNASVTPSEAGGADGDRTGSDDDGAGPGLGLSVGVVSLGCLLGILRAALLWRSIIE